MLHKKRFRSGEFCVFVLSRGQVIVKQYQFGKGPFSMVGHSGMRSQSPSLDDSRPEIWIKRFESETHARRSDHTI